MISYIIRRLLLLFPVLVGVSLLVFFGIRLLPGDPAVLMAGEHATPEVVEEVRKQYGLDKPVLVQYVIYVRRFLTGDLGRSHWTRRDVATDLREKFLNTLQLATASMFLATIVGVTSGIISATKPYSPFDYVSMLVSLGGVSIPPFWLGLMLMLLFGVILGWLPISGKGGVANLVLPAITLAANGTAIIARLTRSSMLEVMQQDFITTARAKGITESRVILKHGLKNALIPIVTILGLQFGLLLGGAILTETVFSWPGMGMLIVRSILARDYPVVQGAVLFLAAITVIINLVVDLLYSIIDPRIRYG